MDFYEMPAPNHYNDIRDLLKRAEEAEQRIAALEARVQQLEENERSRAMAYPDGRR